MKGMNKMIDFKTKKLQYYIIIQTTHDFTCPPDVVCGLKVKVNDNYELDWEPVVEMNQEELCFTDYEFAKKILEKTKKSNPFTQFEIRTYNYNIFTNKDNLDKFYIVINGGNWYVSDLDIVINNEGEIDFKPKTNLYCGNDCVLAYESKNFANKVLEKLNDKSYKVEEVKLKLFKGNKKDLIND